MQYRKFILFTLLCLTYFTCYANWQVGDRVLARWRQQWIPAEITAIHQNRIQVHYLGFSNQWDRTLLPSQIKSTHTVSHVASKATATTPNKKFVRGQYVKALWQNSRWREAKVLKIGDNRWLIHFSGLDSSWDKWVGPAQIRTMDEAPALAHPEQHQQPLHLSVGDTIFAEWSGEWYQAEIIEVGDNKWKVHYTGYDAYWDEWLDSPRIQIVEKNDSSLLYSGTAKQRLAKQLIETILQHQDNLALALLQSSAPVNAEDKHGASALQLAVRERRYKVVAALLQQKAEVNHVDQEQQTALTWAANNRSWEIVKLLLEHGANPNIGESALMFAIQNNQVDIVELLIEHNIDVNRELSPHLTPLQLAKNLQYLKIVDILIDAGATK